MTSSGIFSLHRELFKQNLLGQTMNLLRWAVLPAALISLALSSCAGQTTKAAVTLPSPVAVESPVADTFDAGLVKASDASYTAKTAETSEDWDLAASRWQNAIELMQAVPTGSANHAQAQQKLMEYQRGLSAARSHLALEESPSEPVASTSEPKSVPVASTSADSLTDDQQDEIFLLALNSTATSEEKAWAASVSNEQKISLAHSACKAFNDGVSIQDIALVVHKKFGSDQTKVRYLGELFGAGVAVYCPEHKDKLDL
jgi:hypothetical protein